MLNREDQEKVYAHAYLPEHLPAYLESVTASEPHLREDHLYLFKRPHLTLIGYPLKKDGQEFLKILLIQKVIIFALLRTA